MPSDHLERFLFFEDGQYKVRKALRERMLFAVQNVLEDPPFSNLDIISCRNLLIYLKPQAQKRLLSTLHYGLNANGVLLLGSSESSTRAGELFRVEDAGHHVYRARSAAEERLPVPRSGWQPDARFGGQGREKG